MDLAVNVDLARIIQLVDSEFHTRHPELKGRQVQFRDKSDNPEEEEALRAEWNEMFTFEAMKAVRLASRNMEAARTRFDMSA